MPSHVPTYPVTLRRLLIALAALMPALLAAACGEVEEPPPARQAVIDSVFPIEEEIRRFAASLDSVPTALYEGAASREELVQRFIRAVEARDADEFSRLVLQRDEFIGLYYPHTRYTARPYELAPALLWFQMENPSSRGLSRLLARLGGRDLEFQRLTCPEAPLVEEQNRIWEHCTVRVRGADGPHAERRLFGAMLERGGRWKFLSYANEF